MNKKYYPLTQSEQGIYLSCLQDTDAYNLSNYLLLDNDIDLDRFKESIKTVFDNHPYLFTILSLDENGNVTKSIDKEDIIINDIYKEDTYLVDSLPFKMLDSHLYRLDIIHYQNELYFHFDFHHIICDGFTIKLFIDEVIDVYNGKKINKEIKDANEFAILENKALNSKEFLKAKQFYENKLSGVDCDSSIVEDGFFPGDNVKPSYQKLVIDLDIDDSKLKQYIKKAKIKTRIHFLSCSPRIIVIYLIR